ncbi:MAG: hypothetical protein EA401_14420 [Planctomycetota bacterium]|nr:MAG: hypothetical protein EA401_14420 [Planctomycetota bacterium]
MMDLLVVLLITLMFLAQTIISTWAPQAIVSWRCFQASGIALVAAILLAAAPQALLSWGRHDDMVIMAARATSIAATISLATAILCLQFALYRAPPPAPHNTNAAPNEDAKKDSQDAV